MIRIIENQNEYKNLYYGCVVWIVYFVKMSICNALAQFNEDPWKVKVLKL